MRRLPIMLLLVLMALSAGWNGLVQNAGAVTPDEVLDDPALETRARDISSELRCMVCQNQSIDESDAALAKDLRLIVRERLVAGDSDRAVIDYVVSRYGEFVLLKPRMSLHTLLLWGAPAALLLIGAAALFMMARKRNHAPGGKPLSAEEQASIDRLLSGDRG